jgi:hypothetical protein
LVEGRGRIFLSQSSALGHLLTLGNISNSPFSYSRRAGISAACPRIRRQFAFIHVAASARHACNPEPKRGYKKGEDPVASHDNSSLADLIRAATSGVGQAQVDLRKTFEPKLGQWAGAILPGFRLHPAVAHRGGGRSCMAQYLYKLPEAARALRLISLRPRVLMTASL